MALPDDETLLVGLRAGNEAMFAALIDAHHHAMVRLARSFVGNDAVAEEVAQETWSALLAGLATFEGRSTLKTWLFRVLVNRAKTRGVREARAVPMSSLSGSNDDGDGPTVDPDRFNGRGMWSQPPTEWEVTPADLLMRRETVEALERALDELPERQRQIVLLRDALDWDAEEICNVLGISETNQRVLLHRGRARLRTLLEQHFATQ